MLFFAVPATCFGVTTFFVSFTGISNDLRTRFAISSIFVLKIFTSFAFEMNPNSTSLYPYPFEAERLTLARSFLPTIILERPGNISSNIFARALSYLSADIPCLIITCPPRALEAPESICNSRICQSFGIVKVLIPAVLYQFFEMSPSVT